MTTIKNYAIELQQLENLSVSAANAMRTAMQKATMEDYQKFLDTMYHYTRHSEHNLLNASRVSHTPELKEFFEHMAKEERGHYVLAQRDLEGFGKSISAEEPQAVKAINALWDELQLSHHGNGYLGIVYVFENIAKHVGADIKKLLTRLEVTKKQSRWLSVHAEADLEHGGDVEVLAHKYIADNPNLMLDTAKRACALWISLNLDAFDASKTTQKAA